MAREFWVSSGHHLTQQAEGGGLVVTDDLLKAYLARPELVPPPEACDAERALFATLQAEPRANVAAADIAALADADAQENWRFMLTLRDRLVAARTVEAAYLSIVRAGAKGVPPLFLNQLVHLILRNALDGVDDPYVLRAAELFFRPQRASIKDGALLLADAEVIEGFETAGAASPLAAMLGADKVADLDVMDAANAWTYWSRSDAFTMVLPLGTDPRARAGLARVIERFIGHLLALEVTVEPVAAMEDADWRWFVPLDAEATRIGNALWTGEAIAPEMAARVIGLFRARFAGDGRVDPRVGDRPVWLILAEDAERMVRLKPQNLVMGLPLVETRAA